MTVLKIKAYSLSFLLVTTLLISTNLSADTILKKDQIEKLIQGKTVSAEHIKKGFTFKVYFSADGKTVHRVENGVTTKTTYKYKGDKHCIHWGGLDRCASIIDNKDGSYTRVNMRGIKVISWTNIKPGKKLD